MKIVIISFYYPPCQGVASWRIQAMANTLCNYGYNIEVLTRSWGGNENGWDDYLEPNTERKTIQESKNLKISHLPFNTLNNKHHPLVQKAIILSKWMKGNFQTEQDFTREAETYLNQLKYKPNLIISSSFPLNVHNLNYRFSLKNNIPYILDFRDTWNNEDLNIHQTKKLSRLIEDFFRRKYIKKWIANSKAYTTISDVFITHFQKELKININHPNASIYNGFEKAILQKKRREENVETFTISIVGTIYPKQDITFMLDGFKSFLKDKNNVIINFIGVTAIRKVAEEIKQVLPSKKINITDRIPRSEALKYGQKSHVLYYIGWKGYKGVYSGKIFEYLAHKRNILIAPGDEDVLDQLLNRTKTGKSASTIKEMVSILEKWFQEWQTKKQLEYHGLESEIQKFTRENQFKKLTKLIEALEK